MVHKKCELCDTSGRGRHIAYWAHNGTAYLFRVANEPRAERFERLRALCHLLIMNEATKRLVGVTMNSFNNNVHSVDALMLVPDGPLEATPEDRADYAKFFKPPVSGVIAEYSPREGSKHRPFKRRAKKGRSR